MNFLQVSRDIPAVSPETLFHIGSWPVTNSSLLVLLIVVLIAIIGVVVTRSFKIRPGKFQSVIEILYERMRELVGQITASERHTEIIFPLIGAIFVYLGIANVIGLIPGLTNIQYAGQSIFRTPTADVNTTLGMALAMVVLIQVVSIRDWGVLGYLGKFFQFKQVYQGFRQGFGRGVEAVIEFFVGLLDIISEVAKIISLSLRLFGNIYAGEVLAVLVLGAVVYVLPALWFTVNAFFSVIQAMVFGSLVTAYYMIALKPREEKNNN
jgi:F-type H+-transporting ATPase subunit a